MHFVHHTFIGAVVLYAFMVTAAPVVTRRDEGTAKTPDELLADLTPPAPSIMSEVSSNSAF